MYCLLRYYADIMREAFEETEKGDAMPKIICYAMQDTK